MTRVACPCGVGYSDALAYVDHIESGACTVFGPDGEPRPEVGR